MCLGRPCQCQHHHIYWTIKRCLQWPRTRKGHSSCLSDILSYHIDMSCKILNNDEMWDKLVFEIHMTFIEHTRHTYCKIHYTIAKILRLVQCMGTRMQVYCGFIDIFVQSINFRGFSKIHRFEDVNLWTMVWSILSAKHILLRWAFDVVNQLKNEIYKN